VKTWKKRWFVFDKDTGELFYHLTEGTPQPIGVIDMAHSEVHRDTNSANKREFTIHYTTVIPILYSLALLLSFLFPLFTALNNVLLADWQNLLLDCSQ
jgi:hypothetical protein